MEYAEVNNCRICGKASTKDYWNESKNCCLDCEHLTAEYITPNIISPEPVKIQQPVDSKFIVSRHCKYCNDTFKIYKGSSIKYCSDSCRIESKKDYNRKYMRKKRTIKII